MNEIIQKAPEQNAGLSIFNQSQFEQLYRVAEVLSQSSLIPDSLKGDDEKSTVANCFLVVEQSSRWGLSPFAVAQCASLVRGKLQWEGKLVHAVIQSLAGINLEYQISGEGEKMKVIVSGILAGETEPRTVTGTVSAWKTTHNGSPWSGPDAYPRMLRYRGAREWARAFNPAVLLGVYTPDEIEPPKVRQATGRVVEDDRGDNPYLETQTEPEPTPKAEPKAETKAPAGRQKKERFSQVVELLDISDAKTARGKNWWTVQVKTDSGSTQELNTFSESMEDRVRNHLGQTVEVTFTQTPKGGLALEEFEVVQGGLV